MTNRTPSQIGASNRRAGRELERETELLLTKVGWLVVKTGSGQAGRVDLIALAPYDGWPPWLVQCKTGGYVPPRERRVLIDYGSTYSADPVIAYWHKEGRSARVVKFKDLEGNEVTP